MPRAEQKETPRQFQAGINSSGNVARIAIPSVGNHTSHRSARRFLSGRSERGNLTREFRRISRVKTAGNRGKAKH
jgi:hypothetical protein